MNRRQTRGMICFVAALATAVLVLAAVGQRRKAAPATYETYTVQPGDTLWGISKVIVGQGKDPRDLVYRIEKLNGIGPDIIPGQEIKIPNKEEK